MHIQMYVDTHTHIRRRADLLCDGTQVKSLEAKVKELRDELKEARDRVDLLETNLVDLVPRAELNAARKVHAHARPCAIPLHSDGCL